MLDDRKISTNLKLRLSNGQPFVCTFSIIPSIEVVEIIAKAGFDGVILDLEHGAYGIDRLSSLILASKANQIFPIVRVPRNDKALIASVLDAGAAGVIIPQVNSVDDARSAVESARFHPLGNRGANPWVRAAGYGGDGAFFKSANDEVAVFVMIESAQALDDLDAILDIEPLDGVFFGPYDLAQSLGHPGEIDHIDVHEALKRAIGSVRLKERCAGIYCRDPASAAQWFKAGAGLLAVGVDAGHISKRLSSIRTSTSMGILIKA